MYLITALKVCTIISKHVLFFHNLSEHVISTFGLSWPTPFVWRLLLVTESEILEARKSDRINISSIVWRNFVIFGTVIKMLFVMLFVNLFFTSDTNLSFQVNFMIFTQIISFSIQGPMLSFWQKCQYCWVSHLIIVAVSNHYCMDDRNKLFFYLCAKREISMCGIVNAEQNFLSKKIIKLTHISI